MPDAHGIVCAKTGKAVPASLVNNFNMMFDYQGGNKKTYQATLSPSELQRLEELLAQTFHDFLVEDENDEGNE